MEMDPAPVVDSAVWISGGIILCLLVLSGMFSGSETALTAASRGKLRAQADKGSKGAARALAITEDSERLIGTYAITNSERAAALASRPISLVVLVFSPVVSAVRVLVRGVLRVFGVQIDPDSNILAVREEIAGALHLGHSEGVVEKEDRDRILGALDLRERVVEEIMLHRSGIELIDADAAPSAILEQCLQSNHTRLPVYRDDPENIIGVIHAKDLLRPETSTLDEQMRQFLHRRTHFALVVDEYGSLQGLITLEDILEEIVGEITDEFDPDGDHLLQPAEDGQL